MSGARSRRPRVAGPDGVAMTEVEELRRRLQLCEQQLAISMDHAPIGMSIVDNDNRMVRVNTALCRFLGYTEQELLDRDWHDLTHPDDVAIGAREIAALFAGERAAFSVEKRYIRADGRPVWAQVNVSLLRDPDGVPLFRLTQHVDIDARKQQEQHLSELAGAQQAVATELRRVAELKSVFLDAISHELRTPLTVIRGAAETLQARRSDLEPSVRQRLEDGLVSHADRLGELVEEVTELRRFNDHTVAFTPEPIDVADVLGRVVDASPVGSRTQLMVAPDLLVHSDPRYLELIARNLLSNIDKYAPAGPVSVRAAPLSGGGLRLDVIDEGPGIHAEDRQGVFEPFYRAAPDHPRPGTGIGLSLVARTAALHDGNAWLEETDRGTHVAVTLPDLPQPSTAFPPDLTVTSS